MKLYQILLLLWAVFGAQKYVTCDFHNLSHWDEAFHGLTNKFSKDLHCNGARLIGIIANCLAVEGATKEDFNDFFAVKKAASTKAKCFRSCIFKKCKFMDASGNLDRPVFRQYFARFLDGDVAKHQLVSNIVENCLATTKIKGNSCDMVDDYMTCLARDCKQCELDLFDAFKIHKF